MTCRGLPSSEAGDWLRPPLKVTDEAGSITPPSTGPARILQRFLFGPRGLGIKTPCGSEYLPFRLVIGMTFPRELLCLHVYGD